MPTRLYVSWNDALRFGRSAFFRIRWGHHKGPFLDSGRSQVFTLRHEHLSVDEPTQGKTLALTELFCQLHICYRNQSKNCSCRVSHYTKPGLRISIHFIRAGSGSSILGWITIRIQGFNDQILKKNYSWKKTKFFLDQKLQFTYP
jgi:hypothetical protein